MLTENQTQPGHYLGTFVASVLPGLGWKMSVPQAAATSQDKLVHSSASKFHPSHMRILLTRNPAARNVDIGMLNFPQQLEPIQREHTGGAGAGKASKGQHCPSIQLPCSQDASSL